MADWVTISALASAGGTLVLAGVTVASVRSANRAARVAEQSLLAEQRPLLVPSRTEDPAVKAGFQDGVWFNVPGGQGVASATDTADYFVISVRNVGTGIAVLHGWQLLPALVFTREAHRTHPPLEDFTTLTRDLYVAPGDVGFWQGSFRDPASDGYREARRAVEAQQSIGVDILYGDFEGGQRVISRFMLTPRELDGEVRWFASVGRHWNVDRPDPRERD
ncbi:MAG TPA: hypothetical protein VFU30_06670 [Gaiellaceae bacterium]|nr:hypothetical protein [Gaiellaceae bacterium]